MYSLPKKKKSHSNQNKHTKISSLNHHIQNFVAPHSSLMSVLVIKAKMCNWSVGTRPPRAALAPPRLTYRDPTFYSTTFYLPTVFTSSTSIPEELYAGKSSLWNKGVFAVIDLLECGLWQRKT